MTPTDNLYKAAKEVINANVSVDQFYRNINDLQEAITTYEQERAFSMNPENNQVKTKVEILSDVTGMSVNYMKNCKKEVWTITPGKAIDAMQIYSDQQTHHLKAENERLQKEIEELKKDKWISVKNKLPEKDQLVVWYAEIKWSERNPVKIFIDSLTGKSEHIEYGEYGYLLHEHDMYVYDGDQDLLDEKITHWMPLPLLPIKD
jgi:uncharacterized protein YfcZ (UPF0381/DUF406 family)